MQIQEQYKQETLKKFNSSLQNRYLLSSQTTEATCERAIERLVMARDEFQELTLKITRENS